MRPAVNTYLSDSKRETLPCEQNSADIFLKSPNRMRCYNDGQSSFWLDVPHHSFHICSKLKKKKNAFSHSSVPQKQSMRTTKIKPKSKNKKKSSSFNKPGKKNHHEVQKPCFKSCVPSSQVQSPKPCFKSCVPSSQVQSPKPCFKSCVPSSHHQVPKPNYNSCVPTSEKQSTAHLRLGKTVNFFVKGKDLFTVSFQQSESCAQLRKLVAKVVQVPTDLLHLTLEGRCLTNRSMKFLEPGATLHYTVKGKGGMQNEAQNEREPGILHIKTDASEDDVKTWLKQHCGLTESEITEFEFVDGAALFAYDIHTLKRRTKINISQARKIIYLRDHQEGNSVMSKWRSEDVVAHIRQWLKRDLDLKHFQEKMVDGAVLMSYENVLEMEQELELPGTLAHRIIIERNKFLQTEEKPFHCDDSLQANAKDTMDKDGNDTTDDHLSCKVALEADERIEDKNFSVIIREETGTLNTAREVSNFCETVSLAEVKVTSKKMSVSCTEYKIVEIEESSKHASLKLFLQDDLNLLPIRQETYSPSLDFSKCEINVIYHKLKSLNDLEKCFLFVVLCKPDYCRGAAAKPLVVSLWDTIKKYTPSWVNEIPLDHQKDFSVSESRILLCGKELSFDQSPGKVCNLTEFEKQIKKNLSSFPAKILIVDKQVLRDNCDGYMLELGTRKDFIPFSFVFKNDTKYWFFDSCKTLGHFEQDLLPFMKVGKLESCLFRVKNTVDIVLEKVTTSGLDSNFCSDETECTLPTSDLISSVQCEEHKTAIQGKDESSVKPRQVSAVQVKGQDIEKRVVNRRPFGFTGEWRYSEGCLNVFENQSVELKLHKNCPPESDHAQAAFLYKALEYICGCLNERQNGTIYFGVREPVKDGEFLYGEIAGVEIDQRLSSVYFDLLHNYIEKCFPDEHEVVKMCIKGPFLIPVWNSNPKTGVIEIDVMPSFKLCKSICFIFQPKAIFDKYDHPGSKHIYTKNQNKWSGVFRRCGSSTTYVKSKEKNHFVNNILPDLIIRKARDENLHEEAEHQLMSSEKAEKLKTFIRHCNLSMFPILVLPKLSAQQKQKEREYFGFIQYIRWSAIFDFDDDSEKDGIFDMVKDSKNAFEVLATIAPDFDVMSVEERQNKLSFSKKTSWLFANGKSTGNNAFERLDLKAWKNNYWTFIQNAVAFYKDYSVIHPSRRRVLIFVSNELEDGILEVSQNIITAFGWNNILFVFYCDYARDYFDCKLSDDNLLQRSIVLPWRHVHFIVCKCLNVEQQSMVKYVCTASGASVPIMNSKLKLWSDLDVLNALECENEYKQMTKDERTALSHEEEKKFHQGKPVSWWNFYLTDRSYDHVLKRSIMSKVSAEIKSKITSPNCNVDRWPIVSISHMPGAGGTTMGRNILWDLRKEFKCAVIKTITEETLHQVIQFWEAEEGVDRKMLKPLILLSDNVTNDLSTLDEIGLCRKLYRKQKEYMLAKPLAVLIHCIQVIESKAEFCLNLKLTDEERDWMERKHLKLESKLLPSEYNTFIAFLSMRQEFNPEFLQNTIIHFLNDGILSENERELISYMALITCYFPLSEGAPGVPVTCFDALMRTIRNYSLPWETMLSETAQVFLVTEDRNDKEHKLYVRIAHQPYAKVILDAVLYQSKKTLGELVVSCLNSALMSKQSSSHKMISRTITKMLIERQAEEGTTELSKLSPLILEIKTSSFEQAVHVLSVGDMRLENADAIYQQLARLYLLKYDFCTAKDYAQLAVTLAPKRKDFRHTLGVVCSRFFASFVKNACFGVDNIIINIKILGVAAEALKSYNKSLFPKDYSDALSICYSHGGIIETVNKVFYFLVRLLPKKDLGHLGCYLVESEYKYTLFDEIPEVRLMLKNLLNNGTDALRFLQYVKYSHKIRSSGFSFHQMRDNRTLSRVTNSCKWEFEKFVKNLKEVPWLSLTDVIRRDSALRLDLVMLKGCFFESIFHCFQDLRETADKGIGILEKMKGLLDEIFEMKCMTVTDKDNFITVCLALELAGKKGAFTDNESQIYEMCCEIIREKNKDGCDDVCFLRAHLYRMLVTWPNVKRSCFNSEHFKISFHRKYACLTNKRKEPLDAKEHFYVTSSEKSVHICHWTDVDLGNLKSSRHEFLGNFTGKYKIEKKSDGTEQSFIEANWDCFYGKLPLKIRKIRGLDVFIGAEVEFHLAFSLQGPLAFIHRVVDNRY